MTLDTRIALAEGMRQNAERLLAEAEQKIARQAAVIRKREGQIVALTAELAALGVDA